MRLRLYESAITSRSVFLQKICGPATFEFCNKIGQQQTSERTSISAAVGQQRTHAVQQIRRLQSRHSINSVARASSMRGTVRPSVFAALRLINSSTLVTC